MSTITIPADIVRELRSALYVAMSGAAEELATLGYERGTTFARWQTWTATFDRARSLLDRIGWQDREPETDVQLDTDVHRRALTDTLAADLRLMRSIADDSDSGLADRAGWAARARAVEGFALSAGLDLESDPVEQRVTIPGDFMDLLVEALLTSFRHAAQEVEDAGLAPEVYPDRLERFDAIRWLLDALGWGARGAVGIDLDAHRDVLQQTLSDRLDMERAFMADADNSASAEGASEQRQRAYAYALEVERFMDSAGLTIPQEGERDA